MTETDFDLDEVLERLMLPKDVLVPMLQKFAADYADVGTTLRGHLDAGDLNEAADLAHSVKGVSGSLGVARLHQISADLEKRLRANDLDGVDADVRTFDEAVTRAVAAIQTAIA